MNEQYYLTRMQAWEIEAAPNLHTLIMPMSEHLKEVVKVANVLRFAGYKVEITNKDEWIKLLEVKRKVFPK